MSQVNDYTSGMVRYVLSGKDFILSTVEKEYVNLIRENIPNVYVYVQNPEKLPRTPAVVLSVYDVESNDVGIGNTFGEDNEGNIIYGIIWNFTLNIDIWARNTKTRDDIISLVQTIISLKRPLMKNRINQIDARVTASQERGFDTTDRIIQYASHQITRIYRQLLTIEVAVISTYKPISTEGFIESIIFTIGQNTYTVDNIPITMDDVIYYPSEGMVGLKHDEISLLTNLLL